MGFENGFLLHPDRLDMHYDYFIRKWKVLETEPESDIINLFIKREPHKLSKIKKGALRLISGVSITDSLIALWLYKDYRQT